MRRSPCSTSAGPRAVAEAAPSARIRSRLRAASQFARARRQPRQEKHAIPPGPSRRTTRTRIRTVTVGLSCVLGAGPCHEATAGWRRCRGRPAWHERGRRRLSVLPRTFALMPVPMLLAASDCSTRAVQVAVWEGRLEPRAVVAPSDRPVAGAVHRHQRGRPEPLPPEADGGAGPDAHRHGPCIGGMRGIRDLHSRCSRSAPAWRLPPGVSPAGGHRGAREPGCRS